LSRKNNQGFPQNFQRLSEKKSKVGWINLDFSGGAVLIFYQKENCVSLLYKTKALFTSP